MLTAIAAVIVLLGLTAYAFYLHLKGEEWRDNVVRAALLIMLVFLMVTSLISLVGCAGGPTSPSPAPKPTMPISPTTAPTPTPTPNPTSGSWTETFSSGLGRFNVDEGVWLNNTTFTASAVRFVGGTLALVLNQTPTVTTGAQVSTRDVYGYGTYTFRARTASDARGPFDPGSARSGALTGLFTFINDSESEIDFEIEAKSSAFLHLVNWNGGQAAGSAHLVAPVTDTAQGFHDFTFIWTPGVITYKLDGAVVGVQHDKVPSRPANIILNNWNGFDGWGGAPTYNVEQTVYVQSVSFTPAN